MKLRCTYKKLIRLSKSFDPCYCNILATMLQDDFITISEGDVETRSTARKSNCEPCNHSGSTLRYGFRFSPAYSECCLSYYRTISKTVHRLPYSIAEFLAHETCSWNLCYTAGHSFAIRGLRNVAIQPPLPPNPGGETRDIPRAGLSTGLPTTLGK